MCIVLAASFFALNAAVEQQVKRSLRDSLAQSEQLLVSASLDSAKRIAQFVAVVAENAGLKAAVGLVQERPAEEVRSTIEMQLQELHNRVGYELIAVTGWKGSLLATADFRELPGKGGKWPDSPESSSLQEYDGDLYEFSTIPITAGGEEIANLRVGSRFDLDRYHLKGDVALLRDGRILRTTLADGPRHWIEPQLQQCGEAECEIVAGAETYLVLPIRESALGTTFRMVELRSMSSAMREFTAGWGRLLVSIGGAGVILALLVTLLTSRSLSRPLRDLVTQLRAGEQAGRFPEKVTAGTAVGELHAFAESFNRVAAAELRTRDQLERAKLAAECADA